MRVSIANRDRRLNTCRENRQRKIQGEQKFWNRAWDR
jgi:hypothetical protein